jgi:hypothetical protein
MSTTIKASYQKWLWMMAITDLVVLLLMFVPGIETNTKLVDLANWRLLTTVVVPVVVLLLVNIFPPSVKAMMVYWKHLGWLPGNESFSKYAAVDPRISMQSLAKNVGLIPSNPKDQNARWYQLYKLVQNEPEVVESHKSFLMYRDMAALSLLLVLLAPICLYLVGPHAISAEWISAALFGVQYILTAVSARHSGIRFVTTVLAIHSTRKVSGARAPR